MYKLYFWLLSVNSSEALASRDHFFLFWFFFLFLSPEIHDLWHIVRSTCLIIKVKQHCAMLVLGRVTEF